MANRPETLVLKIAGMTCPACERRIETAVSRLPGVSSCRASYTRGQAKVILGEVPADREAIVRAIESLGYQVSEAPGAGFNAWQLIGIAVILLGLLLIAQRTGIFNRVPQVTSSMGYGLLFVVGLLTSVHCLAMCGGINLSQSVRGEAVDGGSTLARVGPGLLYNAGRVVSYTVIGGAVGALGSVLSVSGKARGILVLVAGVFMVLMGLNQLGLFPGLRRLTPRLPRFFGRAVAWAGSGRGPFVVGLLNGFMPCGPLQAMQLYALGTGSFLAGALSMLLFSLGTVPLTFGLGALGSLLSHRFSRRLLKVSALLVMILGAAMLGRGLSLSGIDLRFWQTAPAAAANIARLESGVQRVETTMQPNRYEPIIVQKGLPVKWTIKADPDSLNGCNNPVTIPAYGLSRRLQPGANLIEFTPQSSGNVLYTCWMGMISSTIRVVDDLGKVTARDVKEAERYAATAPKGGSCCSGQTANSGPIAGADAPLPEGFTLNPASIALARIRDGTQYVQTAVSGRGYSPAVVVLQRGVPAEWTFQVGQIDEESYRIVFPAYNARLELQKGANTVTLTPAGDFTFDSWRGTLHGYIRVVDDLSAVKASEVQAYVQRRLAERITAGRP
jgi:sulfite exporter TauE/SafE/plastocyanin domain-containing protein/copper chaperone CopZ